MVVCKVDMKIHRNVQLCIIVHHDQFKNDNAFVNLYCAEKWAKVVQEGPSEHFLIYKNNKEKKHK